MTMAKIQLFIIENFTKGGKILHQKKTAAQCAAVFQKIF